MQRLYNLMINSEILIKEIDNILKIIRLLLKIIAYFEWVISNHNITLILPCHAATP